MSFTSPFSVSAVETEVDADPQTRALWTRAFAEERCIWTPQLFEAKLSNLLRRLCDQASFVASPAPGVGMREVEAEDRVGRMLSLALSRPSMMSWLEAVTGQGALRAATGVLSRARASASDLALDWHDDLAEQDRRIAISINLSDSPFEGGIFEMRRKQSESLIKRHAHAGFGSALLFQVGRELEHRVTPVTSGGPRVVFAGWFLAAS